MTPDYYAVLEVHPRARPEVIKAAYRALIDKYHPDRPTGDNKRAQLVNEAYGVLSDPTRRRQYDQGNSRIDGVVIGERYRIIEQIAEGGFGKTYKGEHLVSRKLVCVKHCNLISPQAEMILIEEAEAMWDLRHFSMPAVRDLIRLEDGSLALVMSYIPGPTLEQLVQKVGKLDPEHAAWIMERVLNALKYMHYHGVVHGDIKPQNIIVQPQSHTIVVVDFGLSLLRPEAGANSKGYTPIFGSPEEIKGERITPESDFYSLAMTIAYALNGGDLARTQRRDVPGNVPDSFIDLLKAMLARERDRRPNWQKADLCDTIVEVRRRSFGRTRSGMKPIPGVD